MPKANEKTGNNKALALLLSDQAFFLQTVHFAYMRVTYVIVAMLVNITNAPWAVTKKCQEM